MRVAVLLFCFAMAAHTAMAFEMSIEDIEKSLLRLEELEEREDSDEVMERFGMSDMKDWLKEQALSLKDKAKTSFLENGGAELLTKGKALLDKYKVKVDPVRCADNLCKCCISIDTFPMSGNSACAQFGIVDKFTVGCSLTVNGAEIFQKYLGLKSLTAACAPMPFPIGSMCLQGMEYSKNKDNNEKSFCLAVVLSQYNVGARMCATQGPKGLVPTFQTLKAEALAEQSKFLFKFDGKSVTSILSELWGAPEK